MVEIYLGLKSEIMFTDSVLNSSSKKSGCNINLIPMVNVIFLLLTFFMVAGTVDKTNPFNLNLPLASGVLRPLPKQVTTIYLRKDGKMVINDDLVNNDDFLTIINAIVADGRSKELVVKADGELAATDLLYVVEASKNAGIKKVTIVTKRLK